MKVKHLLYLGYYIWCETDGWINAINSICLPDGNEGRICCKKCGKICGYTWDSEWNLCISNRRTIRVKKQNNDKKGGIKMLFILGVIVGASIVLGVQHLQKLGKI